MFDNNFEVLLADTEWAKNIHYNLRYRVYCLERGYEDPQAHPDSKERDIYDDTSAHFLIRSLKSREWLGALRLITVPFELLPISQHSEIDKDQLPKFSRREVAEASRLCAITPQQKLAIDAGLTTSWLTMGLIRAARRYCLDHDIHYCFFLIADSLARILKRVGMELTPVGPVVDYRGKRRPYIHDVQLGYREMPFKAPEVHEMFCKRGAYQRFSESYPITPNPTMRPAARQRPYGNLLFGRSV